MKNKALPDFNEVMWLYAECAAIYERLLRSRRVYDVPSLGVGRVDELNKLTRRASRSFEKLVGSHEYSSMVESVRRLHGRLAETEEATK